MKPFTLESPLNRIDFQMSSSLSAVDDNHFYWRQKMNSQRGNFILTFFFFFSFSSSFFIERKTNIQQKLFICDEYELTANYFHSLFSFFSFLSFFHFPFQ